METYNIIKAMTALGFYINKLNCAVYPYYCGDHVRVALVKMSDRIANRSNPQLCWIIEKKQYYFYEASLILDRLAFSGKKMAQQLEYEVKNYKIRFVKL